MWPVQGKASSGYILFRFHIRHSAPCSGHWYPIDVRDSHLISIIIEILHVRRTLHFGAVVQRPGTIS